MLKNEPEIRSLPPALASRLVGIAAVYDRRGQGHLGLSALAERRSKSSSALASSIWGSARPACPVRRLAGQPGQPVARICAPAPPRPYFYRTHKDNHTIHAATQRSDNRKIRNSFKFFSAPKIGKNQKFLNFPRKIRRKVTSRHLKPCFNVPRTPQTCSPHVPLRRNSPVPSTGLPRPADCDSVALWKVPSRHPHSMCRRR